MANIIDHIKNLFIPSGKMKSQDFYYLKDKIGYWRKSGSYPDYYQLPALISFPTKFWNRIKDVHRYTLGDKHERAVSVWWADGEYVLTENIRGSVSRVNIPKQSVSVRYEPIGGKRGYFRKIIEANGKVYSKDTEYLKSPGKKKVEVRFLFNMHTHPPNKSSDNLSNPKYSFFSMTDIKSFVKGSAAVTGLVTDKMWLLFKTSKVNVDLSKLTDSDLSPKVLASEVGLKVYSGEFGGKLVVVE